MRISIFGKTWSKLTSAHQETKVSWGREREDLAKPLERWALIRRPCVATGPMEASVSHL